VDASAPAGAPPATPERPTPDRKPPAAAQPAANGKAATGKPPGPAAQPEANGKPAGPRKAARPKPPAGLTVTLAYGEGEWTVAANQGSKALAKPYVIKPAEALRMVSLVDVPGVHDAVEEIVTAARTDAQRQAERLRAELAEIEARLVELREAE
jgi:hypothetical protein